MLGLEKTTKSLEINLKKNLKTQEKIEIEYHAMCYFLYDSLHLSSGTCKRIKQSIDGDKPNALR